MYRLSSGRGSPLRLVLPRSSLRKVLESSHSGSTGGHFGVAKTLDRLRTRFWCPGLAKKMGEFVRACAHCQKFKVPPGKIAGLLNPIHVVKHPFEVLGLDLVGPLIKTERGNEHALVVVDYMTRWVEVAAVPDLSAGHVCSLLNSVILRHGPPTKVITDIGSMFASSEFAETLQCYGIQHAKSSMGHPQSNGLCGRNIRTVAEVISACVDEFHGRWDLELERAAARKRRN